MLTTLLALLALAGTISETWNVDHAKFDCMTDAEIYADDAMKAHLEGDATLAAHLIECAYASLADATRLGWNAYCEDRGVTA